jgi:LemA protein
MTPLIVAAVLLVVGGMMYNGLVRLREQAESAWADIDVQLKRRYDLVPNLVETVKGYASHEKSTFEAVVQARSAAMSATGPQAKAQAEGMLTGALKSLFALAEAYPDLKAEAGFRELQGQLSSLEDAVQKARRYYNAVVRDLNTKVQSVPTNIVARAFGFQQKEFFELAESERDAPKVDFS